MRHRIPLILLGGAFLVSGASALVYQVAWQRILALHTGVGAMSIAVIVGAFMAGLGLGSHLGGRWSTPLSPTRALRSFALVELGIGAFGAASAWLYYDLLYVRFAHLYRDPWTGALLHLGALLLPTMLMGMSLPLLVKGSVRSVTAAPRTIGVLYGLNVFGASAGSLLTPWVLVRLFGVRGALLFAAAGNVAAGACALWVASRTRLPGGEAEEALPTEPRTGEGADPWAETSLALWTALYAASGFCALALELIWFRLVDVAVKSTAFTFGTVLSIYLLGAGAGSLIMASRARTLRRPLQAFLLCQCLLLAYSALVIVLLTLLPLGTPGLRRAVVFWQEPSPGFALPGARPTLTLLGLYGLLPLVLFGPPTLLMGASFPILHRAVQDDPGTSGRKTGLLQAANIAGCTLASLGLGLFGFSVVGTAGALRGVLIVGLGFALLGAWHGPRPPFAGLGALLVALTLLVPGGGPLWRRLHGSASTATLVGEDATGVAALSFRGRGRWNVVFGGKSHSWIPFGGIHSQLGAIPAVVHPAPVDVAIIGLGSGDSAWAAACRPETRSLTVFELSAVQPRLLRALAESAKPPRLRSFLDDPRLRIRVEDGRNALATEEALYDIIEADALWPTAAYSGNLYSEEFFSLCRRRLKPGGIMCTWSPTARVAAGFLKVFPHVAAVQGGRVLLGSGQRIPFVRASWKELLSQGPVVDYLGEKLAFDVLDALRRASRVEARGAWEANEDLFPRDEFAAPSHPDRVPSFPLR